MSYWYAGLYVVIEGWQALGLADPEVDELLCSSNVDLLRRYRNGTFHFRGRYFDDRFIDLIREGEAVVPWVRVLNSAFGRFFIEHYRRRRLAAIVGTAFGTSLLAYSTEDKALVQDCVMSLAFAIEGAKFALKPDRRTHPLLVELHGLRSREGRLRPPRVLLLRGATSCVNVFRRRSRYLS